ncbi:MULTISPECIES: hypothetical protein [unclassified Streptomyces]|uniref:hypothetical protein n=1 Tax=unclassified Streptomyces TaxID=2593676 RepID=UPI0035DE698E
MTPEEGHRVHLDLRGGAPSGVGGWGGSGLTDGHGPEGRAVGGNADAGGGRVSEDPAAEPGRGEPEAARTP